MADPIDLIDHARSQRMARKGSRSGEEAPSLLEHGEAAPSETPIGLQEATEPCQPRAESMACLAVWVEQLGFAEADCRAFVALAAERFPRASEAGRQRKPEAACSVYGLRLPPTQPALTLNRVAGRGETLGRILAGFLPEEADAAERAIADLLNWEIMKSLDERVRAGGDMGSNGEPRHLVVIVGPLFERLRGRILLRHPSEDVAIVSVIWRDPEITYLTSALRRPSAGGVVAEDVGWVGPHPSLAIDSTVRYFFRFEAGRPTLILEVPDTVRFSKDASEWWKTLPKLWDTALAPAGAADPDPPPGELAERRLPPLCRRVLDTAREACAEVKYAEAFVHRWVRGELDQVLNEETTREIGDPVAVKYDKGRPVTIDDARRFAQSAPGRDFIRTLRQRGVHL